MLSQVTSGTTLPSSSRSKGSCPRRVSKSTASEAAACAPTAALSRPLNARAVAAVSHQRVTFPPSAIGMLCSARHGRSHSVARSLGMSSVLLKCTVRAVRPEEFSQAPAAPASRYFVGANHFVAAVLCVQALRVV